MSVVTLTSSSLKSQELPALEQVPSLFPNSSLTSYQTCLAGQTHPHPSLSTMQTSYYGYLLSKVLPWIFFFAGQDEFALQQYLH